MNFGIVGLGNIANQFAQTLKEMNICLYAVASRDIKKAEEFANKYNATKYYGSYEELYNDPNIQVVYIATPNNYHFKNSFDALCCGKHVICEKPFTTNPNDAIKLYNLAKENNLFIMEALWIFFLPAYKKIKEIINDGIIGDIKDISVNYGFDTNNDRKKRKFDSDLAGRALLDIGIYNLGFIDMIINDEIESFDSSFHLNEYNTDDYSEISLISKNGIKAKCITAIGKEIKREAYINGTKGTIYIPDFQQNQGFKLIINNEEKEYSYPFIINGFEYQIKDAIESIKNNKNESNIYPSIRSIRLMKLLYDIRMSWNMKFIFEK